MCREREHDDNQALYHASPPRKNAPHSVPVSHLASLTAWFRASQAFCRGPERRLRATFARVDPPFCRGAFFWNVGFHFRVVHQDPQAGRQQKDTPADGPQT
jgi:hypothetical protein